LILTVGDIFLEAAADFHDIYPEYTGNLPHAETALSREIDENPDFRLFTEVSFTLDSAYMIAHRTGDGPQTRCQIPHCSAESTAPALSSRHRRNPSVHGSR
jgi:hypothetical protein